MDSQAVCSNFNKITLLPSSSNAVLFNVSLQLHVRVLSMRAPRWLLYCTRVAWLQPGNFNASCGAHFAISTDATLFPPRLTIV